MEKSNQVKYVENTKMPKGKGKSGNADKTVKSLIEKENTQVGRKKKGTLKKGEKG